MNPQALTLNLEDIAVAEFIVFGQPEARGQAETLGRRIAALEAHQGGIMALVSMSNRTMMITLCGTR